MFIFVLISYIIFVCVEYTVLFLCAKLKSITLYYPFISAKNYTLCTNPHIRNVFRGTWSQIVRRIRLSLHLAGVAICFVLLPPRNWTFFVGKSTLSYAQNKNINPGKNEAPYNTVYVYHASNRLCGADSTVLFARSQSLLHVYKIDF